ncbi:MAG TPA: alkaline phosphatase family protein [Terriglobales bacterium]|nr:alkaline phosphatase family protein [Terriglobales bacterium]
MNKWLLWLLAICLPCGQALAQVPRSRHVWLVAEENHSFEDAEAAMPYLMAVGSQYGIAAQYYADMHNSLSALMHLTAGQTVTTDDNTPDTFNVDNLVRHMVKKGLSFRSYQQGLPNAGFLGLWSGHYVKRHNPLAYFSDVADSSLRFQLVPLPQLASDLKEGKTADFNYVTPDLDNDAHDGSLQAADEWLRQQLPSILALPEFQPGGDGLLFVVFDEGNLGSNPDFRCNASNSDSNCGGRVLTVVAGPNVRRGFESQTFYNHESLLATVCQALGTDGCPGKADKAQAMADFFIAPLVISPAATTVSQGQTAQYALSVSPVSGFYDAEVKFSCGQLPSGMQCAFAPGKVWPTSGGATTTLAVTTSANSARLSQPFGNPLSRLAFWLCAPGLAVVFPRFSRRKCRLVLTTAAVAMILFFCFACGGISKSFSPSSGGASSEGRSYSIEVTAKSSSASFTVPVQLRVTN